MKQKMATIQVVKVKDKSFLGMLVSIANWSKFSHGAMLHLEANDFYEMQMRGPRRVYKKQYKWDYEVVRTVEMPLEEFYNRINKYRDVRYDYTALLLFYINRWFKTEFGKSTEKMMCIEYIGKVLGIPEYTFKTAPKEMGNKSL